jgi:hypothetical protein
MHAHDQTDMALSVRGHMGTHCKEAKQNEPEKKNR